MMNIVLITDENYVVPTGTTMASVLNSNPNESFTFYIVTKCLSEKQIYVLQSFIKSDEKNAALKIITLPDELFTSFPIREGDHVSVATYYRIYFPALIPESVNKILFLDGDILCVDSLRSFYDMDLTGHSCAVTHDEQNNNIKNFSRLNYPKENGYFCAGVMLVNLEWWREHNVMQECLEFIKSNPDACLWHDQDALNHVLNGTVKWADFRYNFMQGYFFEKKSLVLDSKYYPEVEKASVHPCILHFSSMYKPWHVECNHPLKKLYRDFYKKCTGKRLHLTHRLTGKKRFIWGLKWILNSLKIRHFADFRKPLFTPFLLSKYQFFEYSANQKIAGSKAPSDCRLFAEQSGFKPFYFFHWGERNLFHRLTGQIRRFFEYFFAFLRIKKNSILFLQFPYARGGLFGRKLFFRYAKKIKKIKVITLIHDLNELRYENSEKEIKLMDFAIACSDFLIAHNENMCDYLSAVRGISPKKILSLDLFDYYVSEKFVLEHIPFEKSISIAGNLDANKSAYLRALPNLDLPIYLYGMNYNNNNNNNNIVYKGCFEPECITNELCHGFGLVWDGISADTCDGLYGKYLRYNNPHKLSMYLTAGLPVIVWKQSALCELVVRNKLGIAVSSLYEAVEKIKATTESEYLEMHENCLKISAKLRSGYFLRTALRKCLERLADSEANSGYTKSDVAPSADSVH